MDCKKCKSAEIRPSQRNIAERALGYIVPVRPYRCEECDLRQWGVMRPILERPRLIAWCLLSLTIALFVLNAVLVIPVEPQPDPTVTETNRTEGTPSSTTTTGDQTGADATANTATAEDPATETTANTTPDNPAGQPDAAPTPTEPANKASATEQAQTKPKQTTETQNRGGETTSDNTTTTAATTEPETAANPDETAAKQTKDEVSDFVRRRQAQNLAKQQGVTPPKDARPKDATPAKTQKATPRPTSPAKAKTVSPAKKPTPSGTASTVKFSHHLNGDILTIDVVSAGLMSEAKIKDFLLDQKKLIIDFPGKFSLVPETMTIQHRDIRQVRTGIHRDYMRLVLDLTDRKNPQPEITLTQAGATIRIGQ